MKLYLLRFSPPLIFTLLFTGLFPAYAMSQETDLTRLIQTFARCPVSDQPLLAEVKNENHQRTVPAPVRAPFSTTTNTTNNTRKSFDLLAYQEHIKNHFNNVGYVPERPYRGLLFYQNDQYKWGLRDSSGAVRIPPRFDHIEINEHWEGFLGIEGTKGKFNYYDLEGNALLPHDYQQIVPRGSFLTARDEPQNFVFAKDGQLVTSTSWYPLYVHQTEENFFLFTETEDSFLALIDDADNLTRLPVLSRRRDEIFGERYLLGKEVIIDLKTLEVVFCGEQFKVRKSVHQSGEYLLLTINKRTYLFNEEGKMIRDDYKRKDVASSHDDYLIIRVLTDGGSSPKYGITNTALEWIVLPVYEKCAVISSKAGYFKVTDEDDRTGVIDSTGRTLLPSEYGNILLVGDYFYAFEYSVDRYPDFVVRYTLNGAALEKIALNHKNIRLRYGNYQPYIFWGINKATGQKAILDENFEELYTADELRLQHRLGSNGLVVKSALERNKSYAIDLRGTPYPFYIDDRVYTENIAPNLRITDDYLFVRLTEDSSSYVYDIREDKAYPIHSEIDYFYVNYAVKYQVLPSIKKKQVGLISTIGEEIIPPVMNSSSGSLSRQGFIEIYNDKNKYLISWTGDILFPEYDWVTQGLYHQFKVTKDGLKGIVNRRNELVVPLEYSRIDIDYKNKYYKVVDELGHKITLGIDGEIIE